MTKTEFKRHVIISSLLTALAIALIIAFCVLMFDKYSAPSEANTSIEQGTVKDVYYAVGTEAVMIEMNDGTALQLAYPNFPQEVYSSIGYELDELGELLNGKQIKYKRMTRVPWIVEIYVEGTVVDNTELTNKQITATRIGIVITGIIMLSFPIAIDATYLKAKYKLYKKAEKKRIRQARRNSR